MRFKDLLLLACAGGLTACSGTPSLHVPKAGEAIRVSGAEDPPAEWTGSAWISGDCAIETPLPEGYPPPTPPGVLEIKTYPVVRRAEVEGTGNVGIGTNIAFFPLFQHISRRQIAMTAPVEIDYRDMKSDEEDPPEDWTMSFLYRTADDGPLETSGSVRVVDAPAVTVIAVGLRGGYGFDRVRGATEMLQEWLVANPRWEQTGPPRSLAYNGPEVPARRRWSEVQIPIRPAGTD